MHNISEELQVEQLLASRDLSNYEIKGIYRIIRRCLDIVMSAIGCIVACPILVVTGVAIKIEDRGPIFYSQERVGLNGKSFNVYKLRSMIVNAEKNGAQWADKNDSRVTKVGSFIRKTRIDELPQLLNVLKGDMSIIGPRPERPNFTLEYSVDMPDFVDRLAVRPGLTGWAQVNGGYDITPKEKLVLDKYYLENKSLLMDLNILVRTIGVVITGDGAR